MLITDFGFGKWNLGFLPVIKKVNTMLRKVNAIELKVNVILRKVLQSIIHTHVPQKQIECSHGIFNRFVKLLGLC